MWVLDNMAVNMNGEKTMQNMMMNYSIHKGSFLSLNEPNSFFKNCCILHTVIFHIHVRGWKKNTAGVDHSCCCAIADILWSRNRLQEISKIYK